MLLGFAEDPSQTGNFEAFSMWVSMGITYDSLASDKAANPGRKYMISIGGSADSGGTFGIAGGMSVSQWVDNADNSISSIVNSYNADGVDIQVSIFQSFCLFFIAQSPCWQSLSFACMFEFALLVRLLMNARGMLLEYSFQPRPNNHVMPERAHF